MATHCLSRLWHKTVMCSLTTTQKWLPISLSLIRSVTTRWVFTFSPGFLYFRSNAPKYRSFSGGGGMCIFFGICAQRLFQNVWVAGGVFTFFNTELENSTMHGTEQCTGAHCLFRIRIVRIVVPLHKGWDPIGAHVALHISSIFPSPAACVPPQAPTLGWGLGGGGGVVQAPFPDPPPSGLP